VGPKIESQVDREPRAWAIWLFAIILVLGSVVGAVYFFKDFLGKQEGPKQVVHNISLIKQPPPPPPKPPEKPPEPPKVKEEVQVKQPDEAKPDKPADAKPPSDKPLALDAQGSAGSDNFGLGSRIGGTDLTATGGGGAYYTGLIQRQFYEALMKDKKIQRQSFRVVVRIEIGPDGRVLHATFVTDSGNRDLDQQIQTALADAPPLKEVPPNYLRHDIEVRLSNRT
jgi:protein TonB